MASILTGPLIDAVVQQVAINPCGIHGLGHWARVYANGMHLAAINGADTDVVELFALFHDSRRLDDHADPEHGPRGAELAQQFHGNLLQLSTDKFELLLTACRLHTAARTHDNLSVQTCFDADRLDLGRIGKRVNPEYLCTPVARDAQTIAWATQQSTARIVPDNPLGRALSCIINN
ncbi:MAG: hypothetical protein PHI97_21405 [Desulfobulbus sp.]|nr:hypothetical protein [Desulfobulbus sp.]